MDSSKMKTLADDVERDLAAIIPELLQRGDSERASLILSPAADMVRNLRIDWPQAIQGPSLSDRVAG